MPRKIFHKSVNIFRHYGIFGLLFIYVKTIVWYLLHVFSTETTKYRKVRVNNYDMYIDLKDRGISKALFIYGIREKDQMYIIKNNLCQGSKVLDIGANIGYYVIFETNITGPLAKVIAYEPSSDNCLLLRKNIELNNLIERVEIYDTAVSNKSGVSRFYLSSRSNLHTLNPEYYRGRKQKIDKGKSIEVETVDICEIICKHKDIKFIRMDIEGHEVEVLEGLARAVSDFNVFPDILFETHFPKYDSIHHDIGSRLKRLFELGYFPKFLILNERRTSDLSQRGYKPNITISTDRVNRSIYEGVSKEDAIDFISNIGGSRAVLLKKI